MLMYYLSPEKGCCSVCISISNNGGRFTVSDILKVVSYSNDLYFFLETDYYLLRLLVMAFKCNLLTAFALLLS